MSTASDPVPQIRIARPPMPDEEKLNLNPLDLVFEIVKERLTPAIRADVVARFGAYLGQPQHPSLVANQVVDFLCAACYPELAAAEARRRYGFQSLARYRETILGRVTLAAVPIMGVERIMRHIPRFFAAANNYGTRAATEVAPRHWRFDFDDEIMYPELIQGVLEAVSEVTNVQGLAVTWQARGARQFTFDVTWQAG